MGLIFGGKLKNLYGSGDGYGCGDGYVSGYGNWQQAGAEVIDE